MADTRPNNSDPVGAGCIRSAAGSGSLGPPLGKLPQQPVNTATLSSNSFFSSLAGQHGAAVLGISTVFLLLHGALEPRLSFKGCGSLGCHAGVVLAPTMPVKRKQPQGEHDSAD
ncbi:hypothetical protein [Bordetella genomosp. 12]|uniref:hypothetical protein n=1 Tax=Bordetella genomosp. 12 TaxID=463035 RepID=UPI00142D2D38|nr:hypothetical protein [Bordetella genomosp. 12]